MIEYFKYKSCTACVQDDEDDDGVHLILSSIYIDAEQERGRGHGTATLNLIKEKFPTQEIRVVPWALEVGYRDRLKAWYGKNGFVDCVDYWAINSPE